MENSLITFESLYDMVRKEKLNEAIQVLSPNAYSQITGYLKAKTEMYREARQTQINQEEIEKLKTQIISAKKLVKELYERRERKIVQLAIDKSRIKKADDSMLLPEEKKLLWEMTFILDKYRTGVLLSLVNSKMPFSEEVEANAAQENRSSKSDEAGKTPDSPDDMLQQKKILETEAEKNTDETHARIFFKSDVPKFLGRNLEVYGPFMQGNTATLPIEFAEVLIKRGAAEKISKETQYDQYNPK